MFIHLSPRLRRALQMLRGSSTVADVGSDHGRLAVALLQQGAANRVIASDVSAPSLEKAKALARHCGTLGQMDFRVADGLQALVPGEADAIVMAGMGGLVMRRILEEGEDSARQASRILLQPQGNLPELRTFLYQTGYTIESEGIELDNGRYYQLILAHSGPPAPIPAQWPAGYFELGPAAYIGGEPLLLPLAKKYLAGHEKRLARAQRNGFSPPQLTEAIQALRTIIALLEENHAAS